MKIVKLVTVIAFGVVFAFASSNSVFASAKTDYDYQWAKYRENYSEFALLKRDYIDNPTLDNQQKAILSAKQTILARDLAKSSYAKYLIDLINTQKSGYKELDPIISKLDSAATYYAAEAQLSQQIITAADIKKFALSYLDTYFIHDRSLLYGQVAAKVAQLVRFQIDAKDGLDAMIPKLPNPRPAALESRLNELPTMAANINTRIAFITSLIIPEDEEGLLAEENYFGPFTDKIEEVRQMQSRLVDMLIDIDTNYVQSKI